MALQFQYPQAFWLLLLLPLFFFLFFRYKRWKQRVTKQLGNPRLVNLLTGNHNSTKEWIKLSLFCVAFALGCVALANPRKPDEASAEIRRGIDVVIALDVSNSMLAADVQPSRLQAAQQMLQALINNLKNDRVGLVVFAGSAYTQMPLSTDHAAAQLFVSTANPKMVPEQGTAIEEALLQSQAAFSENDPRFKTIILVTDGETHDEGAVAASEKMAKKGIMINTIGLGTPGGTTLLDSETKRPKLDEQGNAVISKLNEDLLTTIAQNTNGVYINHTAEAATLQALQDQYKNVDRKALPDTGSLYYESFYWWFLLPMFLLLIIDLFTGVRKQLV